MKAAEDASHAVQAASVTARPSTGGSKSAKLQSAEAQQFVDAIADLAQAGNVAVDVLALGDQAYVDPALAELCRSSGGSISVHASEYWPHLAACSSGMLDMLGAYPARAYCRQGHLLYCAVWHHHWCTVASSSAPRAPRPSVAVSAKCFWQSLGLPTLLSCLS